MTGHVRKRELRAPSRLGKPRPPHRAVTQARIGRTYRFEAAHHLPLLADGHKCRTMHGHSYRVDVVVGGGLDARGLVMDFAEIDAEVLPLIARIDHRVLNDVEGLENPTAELIAAWLLERVAACESVRVYENDDCWAEVHRAPARS
ncbi:MAG TPA: 6-carboxytetrahydropterin synthase [Hyphomicrobiaceae bacterium]|nr:6-carboxytetrahydropterin synthase [Hyphomicrobiaceae bacterium]